MKKFILIFGFISLFFNCLTAQDTLRLTLEECLQYAEAHNFSIQSANINISTTHASNCQWYMTAGSDIPQKGAAH